MLSILTFDICMHVNVGCPDVEISIINKFPKTEENAWLEN